MGEAAEGAEHKHNLFNKTTEGVENKHNILNKTIYPERLSI
jgi:hypothetical protein